MSAYKGRTVKNKSFLRKEARFIEKFNKLIANQSNLPVSEELLEKLSK